MLQAGKILGNRYEIINLVGSGGMAEVYKAKCHKLNRYVAIKVLKEEFGKDADFVKRFHTEAQAAAGLMHPNIVNVYDVGEGDDLHYIVMELVEGITLKEYIHQKGKLDSEEVIVIATQIGLGLEAAHKNNTVHRDIKPQNIIITDDGRIKVADFGIARASNGNTITPTAMGSVHYFSPEQARGGYVDCRSDIYSLGISMYEMATGHVPFDGDNAVSIALKHIQDDLVFEGEEKENISDNLMHIILKATAKKPEQRYATISDMLDDLKKAYQDENGGLIASEKNVAVSEGATVIVKKDEVDKIKELSGEKADTKVSMSEIEEEDDSEEKNGLFKNTKDMDPQLEKIIRILCIIVGGIFAVIFLIFLATQISRFAGGMGEEKTTEDTTEQSSTDTKETVAMPNLVNNTWEEAMEILEEYHLEWEIVEEISNDVESGFVIRQSVKRGDEIEVGTKVTIVVSIGKDSVQVPEVVGKEESVAKKAITDAGFQVATTEEYSSTVKEGYVISQDPEGYRNVDHGSTITLVISKGTEQVSVPSVVGRTKSEAETILGNAGLSIGTIEKVSSDRYEEGIIISQDPENGNKVAAGTKINIVISSGSASVSYIGKVTISENPFGNDMASGTVKLVLNQNGNTKTIYNADVTADDFPLTVSFEGFAEGSATVDIYVNGSKTGTQNVTVEKAN